MKSIEPAFSPNKSSRGDHKPRLIVYHIADGYYEGTKGWFSTSESQTSSHFIVARDGRICQCVPIAKMAWCNGTTDNKKQQTWVGHSELALVRQLGGNVNQYSVSIECEGFWNECKGGLSDAQLASLVWLTQHIRSEVRKQYGISIPFNRNHLVGHNEVNPMTKPCCPGELFPWSELLSQLSGVNINRVSNTLYRVQVGAFKEKENADTYLQAIKEKDLDAFIVRGEDGLHRVQVGAFTIKANADGFLQTVKAMDLSAFVLVEEKQELFS